MSNINVWKTTNVSPEENETELALLFRDDARSYTDGEELMAVHKIIELLDGLDNGDVLVISRELF